MKKIFGVFFLIWVWCDSIRSDFEGAIPASRTPIFWMITGGTFIECIWASFVNAYREWSMWLMTCISSLEFVSLWKTWPQIGIYSSLIEDPPYNMLVDPFYSFSTFGLHVVLSSMMKWIGDTTLSNSLDVLGCTFGPLKSLLAEVEPFDHWNL